MGEGGKGRGEGRRDWEGGEGRYIGHAAALQHTATATPSLFVCSRSSHASAQGPTADKALFLFALSRLAPFAGGPPLLLGEGGGAKPHAGLEGRWKGARGVDTLAPPRFSSQRWPPVRGRQMESRPRAGLARGF